MCQDQSFHHISHLLPNLYQDGQDGTYPHRYDGDGRMHIHAYLKSHYQSDLEPPLQDPHKRSLMQQGRMTLQYRGLEQ